MSEIIDFNPIWAYDEPPGDPKALAHMLQLLNRVATNPQKPTLDSRVIDSLIDFSQKFEYQGKSALEKTMKAQFLLFATFHKPNEAVKRINEVLRSNDPNLLGRKVPDVLPELIIAVFDNRCNTIHFAVPYKAVKMIQNTANMFGIKKVEVIPKNAATNHNLFWILAPKVALSIGLAYLADEFKGKNLSDKALEKAYLASFLEGPAQERLGCIEGSWFPKLPSCFLFQHLPEISKIEISRPSRSRKKEPAPTPSCSSSSSLPLTHKGSATSFAFDGDESPPADDEEVEEHPPAPVATKKRATTEADEEPVAKKQQVPAADQPSIEDILSKYFDWDHVMREFSDSLDNVAVVQHQNAVESFAKFPKPNHVSKVTLPPIAAREHAVPVSLSASDPLPLMWWSMAMAVKAHFSEDLAKKWIDTLPGKFTNPNQPFSQALLAPTTYDMVPAGPPAGDTSGHYLMALAVGSLATKLTLDNLRPILNGIKERLHGCYETTLAVQEKAEADNRRKTSENTQLKKELKVRTAQLEEAVASLESAKALEQTLELLRAENSQLKKDLEDARKNEPPVEVCDF